MALPAVTVRVRQPIGSPLPTGPAGSKKVTISGGTDSYTLHYTDAAVVHHNVQRGRWVTIDRPVDKPFVVNAGEGLRSMDLKATLDNGANDIEIELADIRFMVSVPDPLAIAFGDFEGGLWRCQSLQVSTARRQPGTNKTTSATLEFTFIEASDPPYPKPTPAAPAPAPPAATPSPVSGGPSAPRQYTVVRGDTLSGIAVKVYGNAGKWPDIARANNISNPRSLQIGKVLTIP